MCLSYCLIISLLALIYLYRNNQLQLRYKLIDKDCVLADLRVSSLVLDSTDD